MDVTDCPYPVDSLAGRLWLRRFTELQTEVENRDDSASIASANARAAAAGLGPVQTGPEVLRRKPGEAPDPADPEYLDWLAADRELELREGDRVDGPGPVDMAAFWKRLDRRLDDLIGKRSPGASSFAGLIPSGIVPTGAIPPAVIPKAGSPLFQMYRTPVDDDGDRLAWQADLNVGRGLQGNPSTFVNWDEVAQHATDALDRGLAKLTGIIGAPDAPAKLRGKPAPRRKQCQHGNDAGSCRLCSIGRRR